MSKLLNALGFAGRKLIGLIAMFGPLRAAKFWVAIIMGIAQFVNIYFGYDLGLDQETLTTMIMGIGAALVWLVPNAKPKPPVLTEAEARERVGGYTGPIERR